MRILVVSDTHNKEENLFKIFRNEQFDAVAFLGDVEHGEKDVRDYLEETHPGCPIRFVKGNCDTFADFDISAVVNYNGVRIFMAHGHTFQVSFGREALAKEALDQHCSYAFFGHLHLPIIEEVMGVTCFNPGSVSEPRNPDKRPTYGIMEINSGKVTELRHYFIDELKDRAEE